MKVAHLIHKHTHYSPYLSEYTYSAGSSTYSISQWRLLDVIGPDPSVSLDKLFFTFNNEYIMHD